MNIPFIYDFLSDLNLNNNREWFQENKKRYTRAKKYFEEFANHLVPKLMDLDENLQAIDAKSCIFRIFRDVRFSNDKRPYKTNFGVFMANGGRKSKFPGYYVHLEPKGTFVGGGVYMPQADVLKAIRTEIFHNTDEFKKLINKESFLNTFNDGFVGEQLKTAPKGFPKDFPDIQLLRYKSYAIGTRIDDKIVTNEGFENEILRVCNVLKPLNQFLHQIVEDLYDGNGEI